MESNLNIILIYENYKFILIEECPLDPTANTTRTVREAYDRWIQANRKVSCYMLADISDVLRIKCEKIETTYEILESLQVMFGQPSDELRHDTFKAAMNTKMKIEMSV